MSSRESAPPSQSQEESPIAKERREKRAELNTTRLRRDIELYRPKNYRGDVDYSGIFSDKLKEDLLCHRNEQEVTRKLQKLPKQVAVHALSEALQFAINPNAILKIANELGLFPEMRTAITKFCVTELTDQKIYMISRFVEADYIKDGWIDIEEVRVAAEPFVIRQLHIAAATQPENADNKAALNWLIRTFQPESPAFYQALAELLVSSVNDCMRMKEIGASLSYISIERFIHAVEKAAAACTTGTSYDYRGGGFRAHSAAGALARIPQLSDAQRHHILAVIFQHVKPEAALSYADALLPDDVAMLLAACCGNNPFDDSGAMNREIAGIREIKTPEEIAEIIEKTCRHLFSQGRPAFALELGLREGLTIPDLRELAASRCIELSEKLMASPDDLTAAMELGSLMESLFDGDMRDGLETYSKLTNIDRNLDDAIEHLLETENSMQEDDEERLVPIEGKDPFNARVAWQLIRGLTLLRGGIPSYRAGDAEATAYTICAHGDARTIASMVELTNMSLDQKGENISSYPPVNIGGFRNVLRGYLLMGGVKRKPGSNAQNKLERMIENTKDEDKPYVTAQAMLFCADDEARGNEDSQRRSVILETAQRNIRNMCTEEQWDAVNEIFQSLRAPAPIE